MQKKSKIQRFCLYCLIIVSVLAVAMFAVACNDRKPSDNDNPTDPTNPSNPVNPPEDENAFGEWIIQTEATCVDDGLKYRTNKKGERQEEVIPAKGHDYGVWTVITEATTMQEGLKQSKCSRCQNIVSKTIGALVDGTAGLEFTYWESQDMYYITGAGDALEVKYLIIPTKYMGKTVIYVYQDSLNDMPSLETVKFASGSEFTYIYPKAFKGCKKLKSVEIPSSVTYLPSTFAPDCDALEEINVSADNQTFCSVDGVVYTKDMTSLVAYPQAKKGIYTLPGTLTSITYKDIFKSTNYPLSTAMGITEFKVETGNAKYAVDARGALYSSDMKTLCAYPIANSAEEYVVDSDTISTIDAYAFANNMYLNSVKISGASGYKKILGYAFYKTSIKTLEFDGISNCETYAIYGNPALQNVIFNSGNTSKFGLKYYSIISNTALKKVVLPYVLDESYSNGILCSDDPFWGCTALEEIAIEQGDSAYTSVNGAIFTKDMTCLMFIPHAKTNLILPTTLKLISSTALKHNESLNFEIVDGLKYYQNWLVGVSDDEVTSVTIKEGTVGLGAKALSGLTLEKLSLPESLKYLSYRSLAGTTPAEFTYHSNFDYIGNSAFSEFGYVGGTFDLGTPSYVGDYAIGYTKFDTIKVGYRNNGNSTILDGSSMGGAFYQSKAKTVMFGPYVKEIYKNTCNKMSNLLEVYIASQDICNSTGNFYNPCTHYSSVTKTKWIASNLTLSEDVKKVISNIMNNFQRSDGVTTTVDGITYDKYARP